MQPPLRAGSMGSNRHWVQILALPLCSGIEGTHFFKPQCPQQQHGDNSTFLMGLLQGSNEKAHIENRNCSRCSGTVPYSTHCHPLLPWPPCL